MPEKKKHLTEQWLFSEEELRECSIKTNVRKYTKEEIKEALENERSILSMGGGLTLNSPVLNLH